MKTVAMIPIKLNNERAPGKNTKKFSDGTPLLTHFLKTLIKVKKFDSIYVFCSNESICDYLPDRVEFLKRPEYLDTKSATPQDILSEFMKCVDSDIYAVCHCTSPFVSQEHIEEAINAVDCGKYDSAFTAEKNQKLMWQNLSGVYSPLNFDADNIPRTQDLPEIFNEVSAAYIFKKEVFTKMKRRIGMNPYIVELSGYECIDIDYPEDFEIADAVYTYNLSNIANERCINGGGSTFDELLNVHKFSSLYCHIKGGEAA